jgi:predicted deacylase
MNGASDGPILWLNGGTHGDEAEGAISIFKLFEEITPETLAGAIVACPVMNPEAFLTGSRGNPGDGFTYDMNRIYPGNAAGYPTARVAAAHFAAMLPTCDLQINIHSGGDHSYLTSVMFTADTPDCRELGAAMGPKWDMIMTSPSGGGNPSSQLVEHGKAAISIELGGLCRTLTADFHDIGDALRDSYLNVLRHYNMIEGEASYAERWNVGHQETVLASGTGMWVGERSLEFLKPMKKGDVLGILYDLHGRVLERVVTPCEGMIAGVRSRPQVMEGEWICFFAVVDEVRDDFIANR